MYSSEAQKIDAGVKRRVGRPNAREAELKHEAMLEAALEEFSRHGFHGASVRAIAERAGVSTRTLYNRYPDKVALFDACLEMSAVKHHFPTDPTGTLHEQLVRYAVHMSGRLNQDRQVRLARVIFRECTSFPQLEKVSRRQFERFQLEPVQTMLTAHGFSAEQAQELASFYVTMLFRRWQNRVIYNERAMTAAQIKANAESVTSLFLNGACAMIHDDGGAKSAC
ncbi:putative TetR family transcriptional regulator [Sphingobium herbicidovorans NBRC 16415]|uniref:TetR family transcriptional regulator n=1 Tax=Sphingobium herbicidovorans (strain ATCC 700291 / DSM 11019 / CCUG 56400 / KCTC 2939 / LMG 18315 / NBRC 16415 / MH) TaxID=1219045 RepID=A0A086P638_SPHHM|nr:TetR/AcrR family transcriptional regulator [Sphingobium herbicidovorans]KFG88856.1 putative TetR family transcriptional regulator [Sphingobium herbicidovorans NBRC 16415]